MSISTHLNVFQGDDAPWLLVCCELKVIQTVVIEDEPSPLPALVTPTLLPQPALLVRVEECVHQVVTVILRDLERLRLDTEIIDVIANISVSLSMIYLS